VTFSSLFSSSPPCCYLFMVRFLLFSPMGSTVGATADMIAVCLSCGNEWVVRSPSPPGVKKKRKCPVCGKYRVRMKSELEAKSEAATSSAASPSPPPPPPPPSPSPVVVDVEGLDLDDDLEEETEIRGRGSSGLVAAGVLLLLVGAAWLGWTLLRRRRVKEVVATKEEDERGRIAELRRYQRLPAVPGF